MALRARTGSVRFEIESLDERILVMEVAKAAGSLRFRRAVVVAFLLEEREDDDAASDSESCSDASSELLCEEARSTAGNSSLDGVGEGL